VVHHLPDGLFVPFGTTPGQLPFLLRCQPGDLPDLAEIIPDLVLSPTGSR
jgi:hypothetical protein